MVNSSQPLTLIIGSSHSVNISSGIVGKNYFGVIFFTLTHKSPAALGVEKSSKGETVRWIHFVSDDLTMENMGVGVMIAVVFAGGFGWGQWYAEKTIRKENATLNKNRISVSMPMEPGRAAEVFGLLKQLVKHVEAKSDDAR